MTEIVDWWKEPALQLALSVQPALADALDPLAYEAVGVSSCLTDALNTAWKDASNAIIEALGVAVEAELKREIAFGTTNHYLSDKYAEAQLLPNSVIDELMERIFSGSHSKNFYRGDLKEALQAARDGIIREDKQASVRENAEPSGRRRARRTRAHIAGRAHARGRARRRRCCLCPRDG